MRPRQIDYFLVDKRMRPLIRDSGTTATPDVGSDHKAIRIIMTSRQPRRRCAHTKVVKWADVNIDRFKNALDATLQDVKMNDNLNDVCKEIEESLLHSASLACESSVHVKRLQWDEHGHLQELQCIGWENDSEQINPERSPTSSQDGANRASREDPFRF